MSVLDWLGPLVAVMSEEEKRKLRLLLEEGGAATCREEETELPSTSKAKPSTPFWVKRVDALVRGRSGGFAVVGEFSRHRKLVGEGLYVVGTRQVPPVYHVVRHVEGETAYIKLAGGKGQVMDDARLIFRSEDWEEVASCLEALGVGWA